MDSVELVCCSPRASGKNTTSRSAAPGIGGDRPPGVFVFPVKGPYEYRDNWHEPRDGDTRLRKGIDIYAAHGTPAVAVAEGVVILKGWDGACGWAVAIEDPNGWNYYYGHLASFADVEVGQPVPAGQVIGLVGATGNAGVPHLHFSIFHKEAGYEGGINPFTHLRRAEPPIQISQFKRGYPHRGILYSCRSRPFSLRSYV